MAACLRIAHPTVDLVAWEAWVVCTEAWEDMEAWEGTAAMEP